MADVKSVLQALPKELQGLRELADLRYLPFKPGWLKRLIVLPGDPPFEPLIKIPEDQLLFNTVMVGATPDGRVYVGIRFMPPKDFSYQMLQFYGYTGPATWYMYKRCSDPENQMWLSELHINRLSRNS